MSPLPEIPFFIIGSPRSGTTLLRFQLASHPRLYIPEETGFLPFLRREVNAPLSLRDTRRLLQRIGRLNFLWHGLVEDVESFYRALPEPTLAHALDALYRLQIQPHGAERWGDKTPLYVRYIPTLDRLFPGSQFIHIIRDGRDASLSARRKWAAQHRHMDMYYLLQNWVDNVRAGRRDGALLEASRYLEVRYETLVDRPEETVQAICDFLGETYHPTMRDHTPLAQQVGPGPNHHTEVLQAINAGSVGRWQDEMESFERKLAERLAGPTLAELGYPPTIPEPITTGEIPCIGFLAIRYHLIDSLRRALYSTGLLTLNRTMRRR